MSIKKSSAMAFACLAMAACSGGGGGAPASPSSSPPPNPPVPPAEPSPGGLWAGVISFDGSQTSELFVALSTDDGRFRFISAESNVHFIGTQVVDVNRIVGAGLGFADTGSTWQDSSAVTDTTTDATLIEKDSFSGSWNTASGESGVFDFFYDAEYERASSLSVLEGLWTAYDGFGSPSATFSIDAQGQFTGQNASGCTSTGQISIIDDRYNLYDVASTISNCFIAGDYTGMAAVGDLVSTNDAIVLSISNSARAILLGLEK